MTNGGSPSHGRTHDKKAARKRGKAKGLKAALRRKEWLPAGVANEKPAGRR
jgi:hypothetical protein